jgi:hypothetical protein
VTKLTLLPHVTADGQRFVIRMNFMLITGRFEELKAKMGGGR